MNRYSYAWEKLHIAVCSLAAGTDPLPKRLADAWRSSLISLQPDHHLPDQALADRFRALASQFQDTHSGQLLVETLREDEQGQIAMEICSLDYEACLRLARGEG